jgi:hypothetical protein
MSSSAVVCGPIPYRASRAAAQRVHRLSGHAGAGPAFAGPAGAASRCFIRLAQNRCSWRIPSQVITGSDNDQAAAAAAIEEARGMASRLRCQPLLDRADAAERAKPQMRA